MATNYWVGAAPAVKQAGTFTITADANGTVYQITIGGVIVSFTSTGGGTTADATGLQAALAGSTHPYFTAVTWTSSAAVVTGTAGTAGVPFTATSSIGSGAGTIGAYTVVTASSGPNDWSTAANWSLNAVPVNTNDVIIAGNSINIAWGFAQSAVTLNSLRIDQNYTGKIGLDWTNFATSSDGATVSATQVNEYRATYLNILVAAGNNVNIGQNFGPILSNGSSRLMLDLSTTATTVTIFNSSQSSADSGRPAIRFKMNSASTKVYVRSAPGGVGIAADTPGETATLSTLVISDPSTATRVLVGSGTTITTYQQDGGNNVLQAAATITTVTHNAGTLKLEGTAAITTLTINAGTVIQNSTGTITTINHNGGTLDSSQQDINRTWTTYNIVNPGCVWINNQTNITLTNAISIAANRKVTVTVS